MSVLVKDVPKITPTENPVVGQWQGGVATSGNPGADLVTIGAANIINLVHSLKINISALTLAANITIRMYTLVNGTEREVYNQTFIQGTDPDGLWVINGTVGIHEALRVEVQSDQAGDNGASIDYDHSVERGC